VTYAAKLSGFYPEDPLVAALADQAVFYMDEFVSIFKPVQGVTDAEEKKQIMSEIAAGPFKEKAAVLSKLLVRTDLQRILSVLSAAIHALCTLYDMAHPTLHLLDINCLPPQDGKVYAAGDKPSHADALVFCTLSLFKSGFMGEYDACCRACCLQRAGGSHAVPSGQ
jgi:glutathione S-transferase